MFGFGRGRQQAAADVIFGGETVPGTRTLILTPARVAAAADVLNKTAPQALLTRSMDAVRGALGGEPENDLLDTLATQIDDLTRFYSTAADTGASVAKTAD